jgi:O-antigen/teichoic acid export membrane protein
MGLLRKTLIVWNMRVILTVLVFLTDLLVSRYAGVASKGEYFFLTNNVLLFGTLITAGLHFGNLYYYKDIAFPELAANSLLYFICLSLLLLLTYPLLSYVPVLSAGGFWLKAAFLACLFWQAVSILYKNFFVASSLLGEYSMVRILYRLLFLLLLALVWVFWDASLNLLFGIFTLNFFILFIISIFYLGPRLPWRRAPFSCNVRSLGKCLGYGVKSQALVSADMGNQRMTAVILGFLASPIENGLYSVAFNFGQALWVLFGVLAVVVQSGTGNSTERQLDDLQKLTRHALPLMLLGALGTAVLSGPIIRFGYGSDFLNALPQLYILLPGFVAYVIYYLLSSFMVVNGKAMMALVASLAGLLVNVLLSYLLIPLYGGIGAAQALCWGYLTSTLLLLILVRVIFQAPWRSMLILQKEDITTIFRKIKSINSYNMFKA